MAFDPTTASLTPTTVSNPLGSEEIVQTGLAYRVASNGTTVYAAQAEGGPEVPQPNGMGFAIDSGGKLIPLPGSPFLAGSDGRSIAMHPSGKFVYFTQWIPNQWSGIGGYGLDANGIPTPLAGSPLYQHSVGEAGMAVDPQGQFLFAIASSVDLSSSDTKVYTFRIAADGSLSSPTAIPVSSSPTARDGWCACVQVSPDGKYLYAAVDNSIAVLTIDHQTGALAPVPGSPFPTGTQIASFAMSSDGNFLFVSDCCSNPIEVFATNRSTTGILTPLPSVAPGGSAPYVLATEGQFVFVGLTASQGANTGQTISGSISVYALDSTTGALTFKDNFPTRGGPETMIAVP